MRTKAIKDLSQLSDAELFKELSEGFGHILKNVTRIENDARFLRENNRVRGSRVLRAIAEEEAAKFLILLDAVRCPRQPGGAFSRQLSYFDKHLPKGIYAEYYHLRPGTFGEIREWVEMERQEYYLDGPNDVDWIFHNEILQKREEGIYVDYTESDGEHIWLSPLRYDKLGGLALGVNIPPALKLAHALNLAGCTGREALAVIAKIWRPVEMNDGFPWTQLRELNSKTLEQLEAHNLLRKQSGSVYGKIIDEWLFPLHSLDLSKIRVDQVNLRKIQEN